MNAKQIFDSFNGVKVLVVGDVMVDSYVWGKVERISPEAPVPILTWEKAENRLGGAANVALNLKALGAEVMLCSSIGVDRTGKTLLRLLKKNKLSVEGICEIRSRQTTVKTRMIAGGQHLLRVDREDSQDLNSAETLQFFQTTFKGIRENFVPDVVLFQDYNKGLLTGKVIKTISKWASQKKTPIVVDPKHDNFFTYQKCDLFKPNLKEVSAILGKKVKVDAASLRNADLLLREQLKNRLTMITLSEKGIFISDGKKRKIIPTTPRVIADVCGAGDTVISVAALGLALALPLDVIAKLSNLAGGQVCEKPGVVSVDKKKLLMEFETL